MAVPTCRGINQSATPGKLRLRTKVKLNHNTQGSRKDERCLLLMKKKEGRGGGGEVKEERRQHVKNEFWEFCPESSSSLCLFPLGGLDLSLIHKPQDAVKVCSALV